ncbi:uncharacterized protein DFL_007134 [Arthrobotrys flagrans]|uniref:Uncharacterized protein n=1 Tax=Arthrobotrys flagrans TaxID=97331 RepID=A0A436ZUV8_ARTFL|nr:hypothetical protein DFL_007134 [Arthrobotrys flagrans]
METMPIATPKLKNHAIVGLLAKALDNLPNLEAIEFTTTTDVGDVPNAILQSHYPNLKFDIREGKAGKWFKNAYRKAREYAPSRLIEEEYSFENAMEAISQSTWQPKIIRFPGFEDIRGSIWLSSFSDISNDGASLEWFYDIERIEALLPKLQSLRRLDILIWVGALEEPDLEPDRLFGALENARPGMTRFLEKAPNVEELRFKVGGLPRLKFPENSATRLPRQFPINPIDIGSLKFNNLRILSLIEQAFFENELKTFLTSHKDTLRRVKLINCVLHSEHQIWSGIFKLLQTDLWLWSFEFHTDYPSTSYDSTDELRIIPWFRVYGNVRTPDHRCELFPKHDRHKEDNSHHIDFDQAMQVIAILENKIIFENNPELNAEKQDVANRLKLVRQGVSPDNPGVQLEDSQIRLMLRQLVSRELVLKFHGIQPEDVKHELMALGVKGFETEDKAGQLGHPNSHGAAIKSAQRRSESWLKHTAVTTA